MTTYAHPLLRKSGGVRRRITEVDQSRALGVDDRPPVEHVDWRLEVEADAPQETIDELKERADARCPGVYCLRNPIDLVTTVSQQAAEYLTATGCGVATDSADRERIETRCP